MHTRKDLRLIIDGKERLLFEMRSVKKDNLSGKRWAIEITFSEKIPIRRLDKLVNNTPNWYYWDLDYAQIKFSGVCLKKSEPILRRTLKTNADSAFAKATADRSAGRNN